MVWPDVGRLYSISNECSKEHRNQVSSCMVLPDAEANLGEVDGDQKSMTNDPKIP